MFEAAATPGAGQFLGVDWSSIALVSVVALVATVVIVTFFSLGLRLLAVGSPDDVDGQGGSAVAAGSRPVAATIGAVLCIGVGIVGVLYGIYLVIPLFHS
jgi:uncharacterized membrane protein